MPVIDCQLLGEPVVTIDRAPPPTEVLWRKHLALCVLFWSRRGDLLGRDVLMTRLWGRKPERAARHSLNEALRVIRRCMGDDAVASEGDGLRWVAPVRLDTVDFADRHGDPAAQAALVRGDFCEGLCVPDEPGFEEWLDLERRDWRSRMVAVLCAAAQGAVDAGRIHETFECCRRALRLDSLNEAVHAALIRAHWLSGNRTAAIAEGNAYISRVRREIGVDPGDEIRHLLRELSRGRNVASLPAQPAPRRPPLIAREGPLGQLMTCWRGIRHARQPVLIIDGPPGSGRSRMLHEMMERASLEGSTVVAVRTLMSDGADPVALLLGVAAGLVDAPGAASAPAGAVAALGEHLPRWRERYTPGDVALLSVGTAVAAVVDAVAGEQPVTIAIDDVDCAGGAGIDAVLNMVRHVPGASVALVMSANSHASSPGLDRVRHLAGRDAATGVHVQLAPLALADLEQLVAQRFATWELPARSRLARRLMIESAGLPAIAVELLAAIAEGMELDPDRRWPAPDRTLDATLPAADPSSLTTAIRMAFNALPVAARELLKAASVATEPFTAMQLARVLAATDQPGELLDRLEWENWLASDARGYSFVARTVRRVVSTEMITPGARRRIETELHR